MSHASIPAAVAAAAAAVVGVMAATAAISRRTGKAAYVDAAWGASFVAACWAAAGVGSPLSWRAWLLLVLVTLWGARLTWHLARRVTASEHDDPRYEDYLGGAITAVPLARVLLKVFGLQAVLVVIVSVPITLGMTTTDGAPWWVVAGAVLWLVGVFFEAVSDAQLAAYRADPDRPKVLATGLWAWSRHPNYFGDFCVWWGFWMVGGAAGGWATGAGSLLSPLLMSWILIAVSGVRLAEKRMQGRPGWAAYAARTPIFLPRPPSSKGIRAE